MALMDFIKKQFIDIIQWTETGDGTLAWRFPMAEMEIQNGASLTVRESQVAVFVNEGKVADVFGPGMYKLSTQTLPVLTYLKNWDKLFESPFKSDVYFFSTRQQVDQKWGTPQPITIRDKDFGAVRLRAFGNYSFRIGDAKLFHTEISGTRDIYSVADLDGQLRGLVLQNISNAIASSGVPFLDLAANQIQFAQALAAQLVPEFEKIGIKLENITVQNVSLPEELQKILDQKIGMGMVGNDMGKFMQYQTAQAIPKFAEGAAGGGGIAGDAMGLGAGVALGQVLAQNLAQGLARTTPSGCRSGGGWRGATRRGRGEPRRRDDHARKARRAQDQGHPHARRVRRQEGRPAQEAGLTPRLRALRVASPPPLQGAIPAARRSRFRGISRLVRRFFSSVAWLRKTATSATTARPAPAAARRSNSARRSRRTRSVPTARAPSCARARRSRAPARWPSCSTTSARCSCSPPAASRTSRSR
jgi:membrane protease subunit (stomatin/prohibitin family)